MRSQMGVAEHAWTNCCVCCSFFHAVACHFHFFVIATADSAVLNMHYVAMSRFRGAHLPQRDQPGGALPQQQAVKRS